MKNHGCRVRDVQTGSSVGFISVLMMGVSVDEENRNQVTSLYGPQIPDVACVFITPSGLYPT